MEIGDGLVLQGREEVEKAAWAMGEWRRIMFNAPGFC